MEAFADACLIDSVSEDTLAMEWVKREFVYALQQRRYRNRIVPLLYKTCDSQKLSWTLSSLQYVEFRKDFHQGCRDLLALWKIGYQEKQEDRNGRHFLPRR